MKTIGAVFSKMPQNHETEATVDQNHETEALDYEALTVQALRKVLMDKYQIKTQNTVHKDECLAMLRDAQGAGFHEGA